MMQEITKTRTCLHQALLELTSLRNLSSDARTNEGRSGALPEAPSFLALHGRLDSWHLLIFRQDIG